MTGNQRPDDDHIANVSKIATLRPCWYCGEKYYRYHDREDSGLVCESCNIETTLTVTELKKAYCWKLLDEKDKEIEKLVEILKLSLDWNRTARKMIVELSAEYDLDNQSTADRLNKTIQHGIEILAKYSPAKEKME